MKLVTLRIPKWNSLPIRHEVSPPMKTFPPARNLFQNTKSQLNLQAIKPVEVLICNHSDTIP